MHNVLLEKRPYYSHRMLNVPPKGNTFPRSNGRTIKSTVNAEKASSASVLRRSVGAFSRGVNLIVWTLRVLR